jgi:DNA-binding CsgD family transcriptional regulator
MAERFTFFLEDREKIDTLITELLTLRFDQARLMDRLLDGIIEMIPTDGPSSLLQCNRFFSEIDENGKKGRILKAVHRNAPAWVIVKLWEQYAMHSHSEIEEALYAKRDSERIGVARLCDLLTEEEWKKTKVRYAAIAAGVHDLSYLWIRCAADDLWILCLRRKTKEPKFSLRDAELLREFGETFYRLRKFWYLEKLRKLSDRELDVIRLLIEGKNATKSAKILQMSPETYRTHMKTIHKKLDAHNALDVLHKLENK